MLAIITIIIVVIAVVLIIVFRPKKEQVKEHFEESAPAPATTTTAVDELNSLLDSITNSTETYDYVEDITKIPFNGQLLLYASTFSSKTNYDKALSVYVPEMSRWNNFVKPNQEFLINTTNVLPSTIKHPHGLPLKGLQLVGINADTINNVDYTISSFTVFMVLKIHSFDFSLGEIELFSISLETPNYIRFTLEEDSTDANKVLLYSHVGDTTSGSKSGISTEKINFTNQDGIAISMVYSKIGNDSVRRIYINGVSAHETEKYQIANDLILGNSKININKHKNLDANILSFMYYSRALSLEEHINVHDYYKNQASSVPSIMTFVQNVTTEKIAVIKSLIEDASTTDANIQEKLEQCLASKAAAPPAPQEFKYKIENGSIRISDADIASCPILKVNRKLSPTLSAPAPPPPAPPPAPPPSSTFPFNITIPYLS